MGQVSYTPEQEVVYWRTVIRYAIIRAERKYRRWATDELTLNSRTDTGDEIGDLIAAEGSEKPFEDSNLRVFLASLSEQERFVIEAIYIDGHTQREIAAKAAVSQPKVSQIHKRALKRLKGMIIDEMYSTRGS